MRLQWCMLLDVNVLNCRVKCEALSDNAVLFKPFLCAYIKIELMTFVTAVAA